MNSAEKYQIPKTMQAVLLRGKGPENLWFGEVPVPAVGDNQLLCRVDAAGVCTSILKIIDQGSGHPLLGGWDPARYPIILGDEGSLTVVRTGKKLRGRYTPGVRFGLQPAVDHTPLLHRNRYHAGAGQMHKCAVGYTLGGCLAEYILIQEEVLEGGCLVPLPDGELPYFAVALAEPISCVLSAQKRHTHLLRGSAHNPAVLLTGLLPGGTTIILGAGIMGRINCELAMRFKPGKLVISDPRAERLRNARRSLAARAQAAGIAFHALDPKKLAGGFQADDIIVAVGSNRVQQQAFSLLKAGGVINLFGGLSETERFLKLDSRQVHYDEIKIVGSSGGDPSDLADALGALARGAVDPGNYVFAVGSLGHVPRALELMRAGGPTGRIMIYPRSRAPELSPVAYWNHGLEREYLRRYGGEKPGS
jgi:threonine dehydrogenase-like Zn-dependent dehydrogenase